MSLRKYRIQNKLSQRDLSDYSGISLRTIQEYEQGRRLLMNAKADVIYKLTIILGCSGAELLETDESENDRYPFSISDSLTPSEICKNKIYSEQYHTIGRFVFSNNSCLITMVYKGQIYEIGFSSVFNRKTMPWIIDAARMAMESAIEEMEFQSIADSLTGEKYEVWN